MKRKELIRLITAHGCIFVRHGGRHDLCKNPKSGKKQPVPRHDEIDELLAKHILDELAEKEKQRHLVIPAKAGIQCFQEVAKGLDTGFHRCDDFLRRHHP